MLRGFAGFQQQGGSIPTGQAGFAGVQKKNKGLRSSFSRQTHQLGHKHELSGLLMRSHKVGTLAASQ